MSTTQAPCTEPVTTVFTWQVRPGREADFEEWPRGVTDRVSRFPGNQGVSWLRPDRGHRFHAVLHFTDPQRLTAWLTSPERVEWHARIDAAAAARRGVPVCTAARKPLSTSRSRHSAKKASIASRGSSPSWRGCRCLDHESK